jgi:hypothetical protein
VLKISWPPAEVATEALALHWWDGAGTVQLLAEDRDTWTMLLEHCDPGTPLRAAGLSNGRGLPRPPAAHPPARGVAHLPAERIAA